MTWLRGPLSSGNFRLLVACDVTFLLFGGVLADRLPRPQMMATANVMQGLAQALFAALVLAGHPHLWQMMALSGLRGCGSGLYLPASQGLVPQTVPADQLGAANAIRRVGLNGASIGGSALGGVIVALAGPGRAGAWPWTRPASRPRPHCAWACGSPRSPGPAAPAC